MPGMVQPERDLTWSEDGRLVKARVRSILDGQWYEMETDADNPRAVTRAQWDAWQAGQNIALAFPQLNAGEREFLMSGITPAKWDETFKDDD